MRKVGMELAIDNITVCVLAGEMDSDSLWEESTDTEFTSNILNGLSVEIGTGGYIYRLDGNEDIQVSFIELETGNRLCDYISFEELMYITDSTENIKVEHPSGDCVAFTILDEQIKVREVKLVSFKKLKSIIQIVM